MSLCMRLMVHADLAVARALTRIDELARQPVEQFRVRGQLAELAEVVGAGHDAAAEVVLPEAIDHHARRQRVVLRRDPVGQHVRRPLVFASLSGAGIFGFGQTEHCGKPGSTSLAR